MSVRLHCKVAGLIHHGDRAAGFTSADSMLEHGHYLTDGANLYRVLGHPGGAADGPLVELEDCRSLEIVVLASPDLRRAQLRPVYRAAG